MDENEDVSDGDKSQKSFQRCDICAQKLTCGKFKFSLFITRTKLKLSRPMHQNKKRQHMNKYEKSKRNM